MGAGKEGVAVQGGGARPGTDLRLLVQIRGCLLRSSARPSPAQPGTQRSPSPAQLSTAQPSPEQPSTTWSSPEKPSPAQRSTAQSSPAQHSPSQSPTAQSSPAQPSSGARPGRASDSPLSRTADPCPPPGPSPLGACLCPGADCLSARLSALFCASAALFPYRQYLIGGEGKL